MGIMKNIRQIFKDNTHLMDNPEVQELIDYCVDLEGQVVEKNIEDTYSKEEIYLQMLKDIYDSCIKTITDDQLAERFKETPRVDFRESVINLKKYMEAVSQMYGIRL
jgi:hypothetical protein